MTKKIDPFQRMLLIIIVVYSVFVTIKNPGFSRSRQYLISSKPLLRQ